MIEEQKRLVFDNSFTSIILCIAHIITKIDSPPIISKLDQILFVIKYATFAKPQKTTYPGK